MEKKVGALEQASMGPRPIRRGNARSSSVGISTAAPLQWGHVQSDVETFMRLHPPFVYFMLQWGHVQSDVETSRR